MIITKDGQTYKVCSKCLLKKLTTEFNRMSRADGYQGWCRSCMSILNKSLQGYKKQKYMENRVSIGNRIKEIDSIYKVKAFLKIGHGKIECVCGCGCNDVRFLEINHKNGGGNKEQKESHINRGRSWYRNIVNGNRSVDDLELTCAPYNNSHKLMLRYNLEKSPFKITYIKE